MIYRKIVITTKTKTKINTASKRNKIVKAEKAYDKKPEIISIQGHLLLLLIFQIDE